MTALEWAYAGLFAFNGCWAAWNLRSARANVDNARRNIVVAERNRALQLARLESLWSPSDIGKSPPVRSVDGDTKR